MRLPPALIALTPGAEEDGNGGSSVELVRRVRECVKAGLRGVVLREPKLGDRATLELATRLRDVLGGGWLCIHDRVHVAAEAEADAVHLGWRSLAPLVARGMLPSTIAIGCSSHAGDDPHVFEAADYLVFGPVRDTPSKHGLLAPAGFDGLARAVESAGRPIWALGGMRPDDVAPAFDSGAAGVAVMSGILSAPDPAAACAQYLAALRAVTQG